MSELQTDRLLEGGCLCGSVRYRTVDVPLVEAICCCDDCQRWSGSGHMPVIGVPKAGFAVEGETRTYTSSAGTPEAVVRHSCPNCGSNLFGMHEILPEFMMICVGSLDRPKRFSPSVAVHVGELCAWDNLPKGLHTWLGRFGVNDAGQTGDDDYALDRDGS